MYLRKIKSTSEIPVTSIFVLVCLWVFACFFFFFKILCFCTMLFLPGQELNIFIGNQDTIWVAWLRQCEGFLQCIVTKEETPDFKISLSILQSHAYLWHQLIPLHRWPILNVGQLLLWTRDISTHLFTWYWLLDVLRVSQTQYIPRLNLGFTGTFYHQLLTLFSTVMIIHPVVLAKNRE